MTSNPRHNIRDVRAPRGSELNTKGWLTEAPLRMLMNNLDPDVAERPHELVVYGGIGRAARTWSDFDTDKQPLLQAVLVKSNAGEVKAGSFSAGATLMVDYR